MVRDFVALHYKVNNREDSEFWNYCRNMEVPAALETRIDIYRNSARLYWSQDELFTANSWNQVMIGQGIKSVGYHPVADLMPSEELHHFLRGYRQSIRDVVGKLPSHKEFIDGYVR